MKVDQKITVTGKRVFKEAMLTKFNQISGISQKRARKATSKRHIKPAAPEKTFLDDLDFMSEDEVE